MTTTKIKSSLTPAQRRNTLRHYKVYRNTGTVNTGQWVYQPHDFDSTFDLWSDSFATRRAATEAAYAEWQGNLLTPEDRATM